MLKHLENHVDGCECAECCPPPKPVYVTNSVDGGLVDTDECPIPQDVDFRCMRLKSQLANGTLYDGALPYTDDGISAVDSALSFNVESTKTD